MNYRVLVVDDDADLRKTVADTLSERSFEVITAQDGEEAIAKIHTSRFDLVLLDVNMPKLGGLDALAEIKKFDASILVIMLTAYSNIRDAIEATKRGAYNYLEKPIQADSLAYLIEQALKARKMVSDLRLSAPNIRLAGTQEFIGQSMEMRRIFEIIDKLSRVDTPVLIRGESGTGKELVAQALHYNGPRKDQRFVAVNCGAIPENLIESEFFGHEKGAFTGADSRKIGKFQFADGGTLFLDEIGDISPAMQVKLLRVLQEQKFHPVGSTREIEVNVRVVAATNRPLEEMIRQGKFREDLYYRLNILPVQLPPLRERKKDIPALAAHFVERFNQVHQKAIEGISPEAMQMLQLHNWPGNIRELENAIERAFVVEASSWITPESLPSILQRSADELEVQAPPSDGSRFQLRLIQGELGAKGFQLDIQRLDFQANKEEFERQFLLSALKAFKGRINQTALHANIPKKTLLRKLEKYGISAKDYTLD